MKKKILIVSLAVNIIAVAFVFYAFTSKAKSTNDGGGYIVMRVLEAGNGSYGDISISDGNSILDHEDLNSSFKVDKIRLNNQTITKKINDLRTQGYELVSTNSGGQNGLITNYVFQKK